MALLYRRCSIDGIVLVSRYIDMLVSVFSLQCVRAGGFIPGG